MLKKWKRRRTSENVKENIFLRYSLIYVLGGVLVCPQVFGEAGNSKFGSLGKLVDILKIGKLKTCGDESSSIISPQKGITPSPFLTFAGIRYLSLSDIVKSLKCSIVLNNSNGFAKITKGGATVQLTAGQSYILYQTSKIYLSHELKFNLGNILVSYDDYLKVLVPLLAINLIAEKTPVLKTIVLDPGHGGKDPGAINARLNFSEKMLVLQMAMLLKAELVKRGYAVILTRETDSFVELKDRPTKAGRADLFVSLHLNSATNSSAQGVEIFTLRRTKNFSGNTFNPWNLMAAYSVLSAFEKTTNFSNRGVKMAEFVVLKSLPCPGILVELGFISNDAEAKKLADAAFQRKIIQGLADGIVKYGENLKKKR